MTRNTAKALIVGAIILCVMAAQTPVATSAIQVPINVVSAVWVTSESLYETGRMWTEIDAAPGDQNMRLRVTIQNISNATISGISGDLKLRYPFRNVTGGDTCRAYYPGSISPGANAAADFITNIDIGAGKGEYRFTMVLNYLELATGVGKTLYFMKSAEVLVSVAVSSTRYMAIYSIIVTPSITVPAGNLTLSGNLLNVGKISAYNTNVTISSPALVRPVSTIVGQVDPNVPRPFSSSVQLRRDIRPGSYAITVSVTYSDSMLVGHVSQVDLMVTVRPAEPRPPTTEQREAGPLVALFQILRELLRILFGFAPVVPTLLSR